MSKKQSNPMPVGIKRPAAPSGLLPVATLVFSDKPIRLLYPYQRSEAVKRLDKLNDVVTKLELAIIRAYLGDIGDVCRDYRGGKKELNSFARLIARIHVTSLGAFAR